MYLSLNEGRVGVIISETGKRNHRQPIENSKTFPNKKCMCPDPGIAAAICQ